MSNTARKLSPSAHRFEQLIELKLTFWPGVNRLTTAELTQFSRTCVGYNAPDEIIEIDKMPMNAVGKVGGMALQQIAHAAINRHLT